MPTQIVIRTPNLLPYESNSCKQMDGLDSKAIRTELGVNYFFDIGSSICSVKRIQIRDESIFLLTECQTGRVRYMTHPMLIQNCGVIDMGCETMIPGGYPYTLGQIFNCRPCRQRELLGSYP